MTPEKSSLIMTGGKLHRSRRFSLDCECAVCGSSACVTIERARDGIELSRLKKLSPRSKQLLYRRCWVPTDGERLLISCASCGVELMDFLFSRVGAGISFTVENLSNVTKGQVLSGYGQGDPFSLDLSEKARDHDRQTEKSD